MTQHFLYIGTSYDVLMQKVHQHMNAIGNSEDVFIYDASIHNFSDVYEELITPPLFTDKKIVLVKNFESIIQDDAFALKMENYLKKPNETVYLFCISSHKEATKSWHKLIDMYMEQIEIEPINEIELQKIIKETLNKEHINIDKDALNLLQDRLLIQKDFIFVLLDKLITFVMDTKHISKSDVLNIIEMPLEDNVFELVKVFISKQTHVAIKMYHDLLSLNEDPIRILQMIGRKLGQLEDTKSYMIQGYDQRQISEQLRISHGQAYYILKEAKTVHMEDLKRWINQVSDLDFKIKSGQIDKKIGMEIFLIGEKNE